MHISDHYRGFCEKTFIVVTNNERARFFCADDHSFEEIDVITLPPEDVSGEVMKDDRAKIERLKTLYIQTSDRIAHALEHEGYLCVLVCVPEVNKLIFQESLPNPVAKKISKIIPKNLASMDIPQIVRILIEG